MLGTGNAMCTRCYNTCFYLRTPDGSLLVDAGGGNGIFRQLYRADIPFESINNIFITHAHPDHILGAVWLVRKISPLIYKGKHKAPLRIYCNDVVAATLTQICQLVLTNKIFASIGDTILITTVNDQQTVNIDDMQITFFDNGSDKVRQFAFHALLPDQQTLVCLGDEPCNPPAERYANGADWLLSEAFCLTKDADNFRPHEKHHSTAAEAAAKAQQLGVKNLILYHTEDTHLTTRRLTYTAEAKQHFNGNIFVPDDIETIPLAKS